MQPNQPFKKPFDIPPHFFRHCVSIIISIAFTCALDAVLIGYFKPDAKVSVRWQDNTRSTAARGQRLNLDELSNTNAVVGYGDDGLLYWRTK